MQERCEGVEVGEIGKRNEFRILFLISIPAWSAMHKTLDQPDALTFIPYLHNLLNTWSLASLLKRTNRFTDAWSSNALHRFA